VWTGYGEYSNYRGIQVPFVAFGYSAVSASGETTQAMYLYVEDGKGNVLINTDPCFPKITDWRVLPSTSGLPTSRITDSPGSDKSSFTVYNPSPATLSALEDSDSSRSSTQTAMIAGIVVGLVVFIIIVAIILYFALRRTNNVGDGQFRQM